MPQFVNYFRIVQPASRKTSYQSHAVSDLASNGGGYASLASINWYTNLLRGAQSRLARYKQFDAMDNGDVTRALDIIAEEMTNPDKRTDLPFQIDYQTEENQNISDTTSTTLRAALRNWARLHGLNKKIRYIARNLCKYGDCFYRKTSDTKKWEYIRPERVIGIELSPYTQEKIAYHIRPDELRVGQGGQREETVEVVPAEAMLHFTLDDEMSASTPFGTSVLETVYPDWQKMRMLEDAAIIYRIVRAPERRVFYVDVGNAPAHRVKQQLEQIKNDLRQKRMPNQNRDGQSDSQFNPESIQEDIFIPVTAAGRGGRVETLPGGATWDIPELEYFKANVFRSLRVPSSYMRGSDGATPGAQWNDGKVGIAYIEELRFANYIMHLQTCVEEVLDREFKTYLQVVGINLDPDLFSLSLPDPQNFALYRQTALDTDLINAFKSIEETPYLSKRFMMKRYLGLTEDDIQMNEAMIKQERSIEDQDAVTEIQQIYDPQAYENRDKVNVEEPPMDIGGGTEPGGTPPPPIDDAMDEPAAEEPPAT